MNIAALINEFRNHPYLYKNHIDLSSLNISEINLYDCYHSNDLVKVFSPDGRKFYSDNIENIVNEYNLGATIYFVNSTLISKKLGVTQKDNINVSVFFSRKGSKMPMHWDRMRNITIQISGKKVWYLAENNYVLYPMFNYALTDHKLTKKLFNGEPPKIDNINKITMENSSVLYVSDGVWHSTETIEDSVSISINWKINNLALEVYNKSYSNLKDFYEWRKPLDELSLEEKDKILAYVKELLSYEA